MFFFEYIIKLLMGNSESVFMGLVVVIFGYYGWLLWNINTKFNSFYNNWERHKDYLTETRQGVMSMEKEITTLNQMETRLNEMNKSISAFQGEITKETDELKQDMLKETEDVKKKLLKKTESFNKGILEEIKNNKSTILKEIEEETDDIKEVIKIMVGKYRKYSKEELNLCRNVKNTEGGNQYRRKEQ